MAGSIAAAAAEVAAAAAIASPALSYTYAHPQNDELCSNTEKQFSVLIYAYFNLLFLAEIKISCLWVGFPNPDHLPLRQLCLGLATKLAKGTIYLSLKLRKLSFQSCYLQLHILALLSTAIANTIVP